MTWRYKRDLLAFSLLFASTVGCGGPAGPERYAVKGEVTLDGAPLDHATIVFEPRGQGGVVTSTPVVNGKFELTEENGPTAGEFDVRINPDAVEETEALAIMEQGKRQPIEKLQVPRQYQRPGALNATVTPDGQNEFTFVLSSKGLRRR